jgi:flagellar hook assembly protein FlgD
MLVHLCYASGNGEPGMSIPGWSVASQRIDNYSAGFLDVGAKSVFALGWMPENNFPKMLMETNKTMNEIFETDAKGTYPYGFIGWNDKYIDSDRSPGLRMHIDPHPDYGFYRALTGGFNMTAADWRGEASGGGDGGGGGGDSGGTTTAVPPEITSLAVTSTDGGQTSNVNTATTSTGSTLPAFHPNGDGLQDEIVVSHKLSESAYLDVRITNAAGVLVRKFTVFAKAGTTTSSWAGKNGSGAYVSEGVYTVSYKPRDTAGTVGEAKSFKVLVLNTMAFKAASPALFARDKDQLAATGSANFTLTAPATVSVKVLDKAGNRVRTLLDSTKLAAGEYSYSWGGRDDGGGYVKDGAYRVVVNTKTPNGSYKEERQIWAGAFELSSSKASPARGSSVTFTVYSTEPLSAAPKIDITQPGIQTYTVSLSKVETGKFKVSLTLKSGGTAGTLQLLVRGVDANGQDQSYSTSLPIR